MVSAGYSSATSGFTRGSTTGIHRRRLLIRISDRNAIIYRIAYAIPVDITAVKVGLYFSTLGGIVSQRQRLAVVTTVTHDQLGVARYTCRSNIVGQAVSYWREKAVPDEQ